MKTKELIIERSFVLFLQNGYKEVSLNDILKVCKISKGAFYHHYKSKDELYAEVLNRFFFSYFKKQDVDYSNTSLKSKLESFVKTFLDPYVEIATILEEDHLSAYFRFLFQAANSFPEIRKKVNRHFYIKGYYLYQIIESAKANGEISQEIDSKIQARQFLSTVVGVAILEGIYSIKLIEKRFKEIIDEYLKTLKA